MSPVPPKISLEKTYTSFMTSCFAAVTFVIVLAWFLRRQRQVIKVDPRCTSDSTAVAVPIAQSYITFKHPF